MSQHDFGSSFARGLSGSFGGGFEMGMRIKIMKEKERRENVLFSISNIDEILKNKNLPAATIDKLYKTRAEAGASIGIKMLILTADEVAANTHYFSASLDKYKQAKRNNTPNDELISQLNLLSQTVAQREGESSLGKIRQGIIKTELSRRSDIQTERYKKEEITSGFTSLLGTQVSPEDQLTQAKSPQGQKVSLPSDVSLSGDLPALPGVSEEPAQPSLVSPLSPEQKSRITSLANIGTKEAFNKAINVAAEKPPVPSVRESSRLNLFENVTGAKKENRGTPKYAANFKVFNQDTFGSEQLLGKLPNGDLVFKNSKGGMTVMPAPGALSTAKKTRLPVAIGKELAGQKVMMGQMDKILVLAKANPDQIGPLDGIWKTLRAKFFKDKKGTELRRGVNSLIMSAYDLSGKQISIEEIKRLETFLLARITLQEDNFITATQAARDLLSATRAERIKTFRELNYELPAGDVFGPITESTESTITKQGTPKFKIISVE